MAIFCPLCGKYVCDSYRTWPWNEYVVIIYKNYLKIRPCLRVGPS
jgi:hypothetical protein